MKRLFLLLAGALCLSTAVSAQSKGDLAIVPRMNIYTAQNPTVVGIGAAVRYNVLDELRLEPAMTFLLHDNCSIDVNCDVQYLFPVADQWTVYPTVGISANDIGAWSAGVNLGAGFDYDISSKWALTAGLKYMIETRKSWDSPLVITIGGSYRF